MCQSPVWQLSLVEAVPIPLLQGGYHLLDDSRKYFWITDIYISCRSEASLVVLDDEISSDDVASRGTIFLVTILALFDKLQTTGIMSRFSVLICRGQ